MIHELRDWRYIRDWLRPWRDPPGLMCCCAGGGGNSCTHIAQYIGVTGVGNLAKGCITYQPDSWTTQTTYAGGESASINQAYCGVSPAVYSQGGNTATANVKWDSSTNTWTDLTTLSSGRGGLPAGAALLDIVTYCFVIAGASITVATLRYSISGNSWSTKATNPSPVENSGTAVISNKAYVFGGFNGTTSTLLSSMYEYTAGTDSFATKTSAATAIEDLGGFSLTADSAAIFSCGQNASGIETAATNEYVVDTWTSRTAFPFGVSAQTRGAEIGTSGYFGGGTPTAPTKEWYSYVIDTWTAKTNETVNCAANGSSCY